MNVLLINHPHERIYGKMGSPDYFPLGLLYIEVVLENEKNKAKIMDFNTDRISKNKFIGLIRRQEENLAKIVKMNKNIPVILGRIHVTITSEDCLKSGDIDVLVRGEVTILKLLDAIRNKKNLKEVDRISHKKKEKIMHNSDREIIFKLNFKTGISLLNSIR